MKMIQTKTIKNEVIAGMTTFLTMSYIIIVNPSILSTPGTGMSFSGVMTATILLCFLMTLLMGIYAQLPIAVAPGMGINAFFTYSMILGEGIPWPVALGMTFWSGVFFLIVSLTPLRVWLVKNIPTSLKLAMSVGIGSFLILIGLKNSEIIVSHPVTFVQMGQFSSTMCLSIFGLVIIYVLSHLSTVFAPLLSIFTVTLASYFLGKTSMPNSVFAPPDFQSVFFQLDIVHSLTWVFIPTIFTLMLTDLFDSISTFVAISNQANLFDSNGEPKNIYRGLIVDSLATLSAGLLGTSAGTAYIESAAGVSAGGRSGITAVVTAICFIPFLFLGPLVAIIPAAATAPLLIFVGILMLKNIQKVNWKDQSSYLPALVALFITPLSFSITKGMVAALISYIVFNLNLRIFKK